MGGQFRCGDMDCTITPFTSGAKRPRAARLPDGVNSAAVRLLSGGPFYLGEARVEKHRVWVCKTEAATPMLNH